MRISRRSLIGAGGFVVGSMAPVADHQLAVAFQSSAVGDGYSRAQQFIPSGMLDRAEISPVWKNEEDYSTATVPASSFDENCVMQVYPWAVNSDTSTSMVFVSEDLNMLPNQVLIQQMRYKTEAVAKANFERIAREALDIFGIMMLTQPFALEERFHESSIRKYGLVARNGASKAMHVELRGNLIFLLRAAQLNEPPFGFIDRWVETAASATLEPDATLNNDGEWQAIYGPIDFHPSVYEAPVCK